MEAATVPAGPAVRGDRLKAFIGTYGLIAVLLALPVYFAIYDLVNDGDLSRIGNNLVDGISNGAIWALVAIGYTLVYGIVELINFAHGEVFMIGSFVSLSCWQIAGVDADTGFAMTVVAILVVLVIAIGMSFILQNVGLLWRPTPGGVPDLIDSQGKMFTLLDVDVKYSDVFA